MCLFAVVGSVFSALVRRLRDRYREAAVAEVREEPPTILPAEKSTSKELT